MANLKEQGIFVTFLCRLGKTVSETHEVLKRAFSDNAIGESTKLGVVFLI
jgi:hypothetical protein